MTPKQIDQVQVSWAMLHPFESITADLFYRRLFELSPQSRARVGQDVRWQVSQFAHALGVLLAALDAVRSVRATLQQPARRPADRDIGGPIDTPRPSRQADAVGTALIDALAQSLGDAFTPPVRQSWIAACALLAEAFEAAAFPARRPPLGHVSVDEVPGFA